MLNIYIENKTILEYLEQSDKITILLLVAEGCEHRKGKLQTELEEKIEKYINDINYFTVCIPETSMEFPYPQTQVVYYFAPKDITPLFIRRGPEATFSLDDDIKAAIKMLDGVLYEEAVFNKETVDKIQEIDYKVKTESLEEFPSHFKQLRNFAIELWAMGKRASRGLPILVDADIAYNRLKICESCPFYKENKCTKCGCFMNFKVNLQQSTCPEDKW